MIGSSGGGEAERDDWPINARLTEGEFGVFANEEEEEEEEEQEEDWQPVMMLATWVFYTFFFFVFVVGLVAKR